MIRGRIFLFDTLRLQPVGDETAVPLEIRSPKLQRMIGYLALHAGTAVEREELARHLWPEATEKGARRNLREYLYRARQLLAEFIPEATLLQAGEHFVLFEPADVCWVDVLVFEQLLDEAKTAVSPADLTSRLQQAISLYRGPLLSHIYDDWVQVARDRLHRRFLEALQQLSLTQQQTGDLAGAIATTSILLEHDPLDESAHRQLMILYYASGDRARALQQFRTCQKNLAEQLGVSPMPETNALYQAMVEGSYRLQTGEVGLPRVPDKVTQSLIGRKEVMRTLDRLWTEVRQGETQLILLVGEGGMGKTHTVNSWLARLEGELVVLPGRCHAFEQVIPFRPLLDAWQQSLQLVAWDMLPPEQTRAWLSPLAHLLPDLYYYLPDIPGMLPASEELTSYQVMEAMAQLLMAVGKRWPVVLFLDDLHWADADTWRCLLFLLRRVMGVSLLIVGTFSPVDAGPGQMRRLRLLVREERVHELVLSPLSLADLTELVQEMGETGETAVNQAKQLRTLSGGNPLLAIAWLKACHQHGISLPAPPEQLPAPPDTALALVNSRLDLLTEESMELLAVAAMIGRTFTFQTLLEVSEKRPDQLLNWLEEWLARGLIFPEDADKFTLILPWLREPILSRISLPRQQYWQTKIQKKLFR